MINVDYNCPVCDSFSNLEYKYEKWDLLRCNKCSHAFSANIIKNEDEIYDSKYFNKNWFLYPNYKLFKLIESTIYNEYGLIPKIHDLGCGNGNFLQYLRKKGYRRLYGSDIVSSLLPGLCDEIEFQQNDVLKVEENITYDVVISIANIEHISDINLYMRKIYKILVPGGIAIIYTVNENSLIYTIAKIMRKLGLGFAARQLFDPHHVNHFNKSSLIQLVKKHQFQIISLKTLNYPLKSTDVSVNSNLLRILVLSVIFLLNIFSTCFRNQISQLLVIRANR